MVSAQGILALVYTNYSWQMLQKVLQKVIQIISGRWQKQGATELQRLPVSESEPCA